MKNFSTSIQLIKRGGGDCEGLCRDQDPASMKTTSIATAKHLTAHAQPESGTTLDQ